MEYAERTLGEAVRLRRSELGLSQAELAGHLATTQGNLSRWERDLTEPRELATYADLAEFLDISLEELALLIGTSAHRRVLRELRRLTG
jgi:transcriptional regulator with XRE-family HTH domain